MNIAVDRQSPHDPIRLTLYLDNEEARRIVDTLRELLGDAKPRHPEAWKPISQRPDVPTEAPKPPKDVMAEIRKKLGHRKAR